MDEPRVGIWVDADNTELSLRDIEKRLNFERFIAWVQDYYRVTSIVSFDYFLSANNAQFLQKLEYKLKRIRGYLHSYPITAGHGYSDEVVIADVTKRADDYDVVVLLTSDGDFDQLVRELTSRGKQVMRCAVSGFYSDHSNWCSDSEVAILLDELGDLVLDQWDRPGFKILPKLHRPA